MENPETLVILVTTTDVNLSCLEEHTKCESLAMLLLLSCLCSEYHVTMSQNRQNRSIVSESQNRQNRHVLQNLRCVDPRLSVDPRLP